MTVTSTLGESGIAQDALKQESSQNLIDSSDWNRKKNKKKSCQSIMLFDSPEASLGQAMGNYRNRGKGIVLL